jgi:F-box-like
LPKLPTELWCAISSLLEIEDAISANSVCKDWYTGLNDSVIWEGMLNRVLRGYPLHRISVPSILIQLKRLASTDLTTPSTSDRNLEVWTSSYKQIAVFTTYLLRVQGQLVDIVRSQTTNTFKSDVSEHLFDGQFLMTIENDAGGYLPLDLVVYLLNFSQHLVPQSTGFEEHYMFALANTSDFVNSALWKKINKRSTFAAYEEMALRVMEEYRKQSITAFDIHEGVNDEILQYLRSLKTLSFAKVTEDSEIQYHLQVVLNTIMADSAEVPNKLKTRTFDIDTEKLRNGAGRVFTCTITFETDYSLTWLAESFTDYMIQYAGLVVKHRELASFTENGFNDFFTCSPRDQSLPKSVLLPQQGAQRVMYYDSNLNDA